MSSTAVATVKEYGLQELEQMALSMFESKFFGFQNKSQYLTLMLMAQAKGRNPVLVVEDYHFFEGKASPKADAVLAWHLASGGDVEWVTNSAEVVEAIFTGPDRGHGLERVKATSKWTIEDARKAGLAGKKNWANHPEDMLTARVIGRGVKRVNPGCLRGERLVEERMDEPDALHEAPIPSDKPVSPIIPRASEMAAQAAPEVHADAVDAEHEPVTQEASQAAPEPAAAAEAPVAAAAAAAPVQRAAKATAPAAPPQPPTGAIRLKEQPTKVMNKADAAGGKTRYGLFFSVGVVGTFNAEAAKKATDAIAKQQPIDIAFTSKMVASKNKDGADVQIEQRELVWIEGVAVAQ